MGIFKSALKAICISVCLVSGALAYSGGDGTTGNPYQIGTVGDWDMLMATSADWGKDFIMTADIDLAGVRLTQVGNSTTKFAGVFNGNDYVIRNITIDNPNTSYTGLFGDVEGTIKNLGIEDVNVQGRTYIGALAGTNFGTITSCYVTGSVSGLMQVGGLAGANFGTLTSCYATGSVTGASAVGGLVGINFRQIISCYASSSASGSDRIGGLVGYNADALTYCYSTGSVSGSTDNGGLVGSSAGTGVTTSCFWDTQTSGMTTSGGGTGKTTTEMKTLSTFTSAGWDFAGESTNGTADIWKIRSDGGDYPKPAWQEDIDLMGWQEAGQDANFFQAYEAGTQTLVTQSRWGQEIEIKYIVKNAGLDNAGAFDVDFYISNDSTIGNSDDIKLGDAYWGQGLAGETYLAQTSPVLTLPQTSPSGYSEISTIYLGMKIDPNNGVPDSNETNNYNNGIGIDKRSFAINTLDLAGYVKTSGSTALSGVAITASNSGGTTTTNMAGYYVLKVPDGWTGKVTATKAGYVFVPSSLSYTTVTAPRGAQNFTAYLKPTISGYLKTSGGTGLAVVTITASNTGGTTTTSSTGYYALKVPYNWTGKITPTKTGYSFGASSLSYTSLKSSKSSQNFTAYVRPAISGYIKFRNGRPAAGVTITASNGGGTSITSSTGYYALQVPYNWTGKITPTKTGYSFGASSLSYASLKSGKSSQNFTAYVRPVISGYVKFRNGRPATNVTITATFGGGTTTTNSSGYYELAVPYEWAGIIKPSKTGVSFKPKCLAYPPVTHSKTSKNYTARY